MRLVRIDVGQEDWTGDPQLADYRMMRDPERVRRSSVFLGEGRAVVRILLEERRFALRSLLMTETALAWLEREGLDVPDDLPVFVIPAAALRELAGYRFHQGCLAAGERPEPVTAASLLARTDPPPRFVVGLEQVSNPDNVGTIFRSAAAFGADAVILSPDSASPLYRKAIRSSIGAALTTPFSHGEPWSDALTALKEAGFTVLALTVRGDTKPLDEAMRGLPADVRIALLFGAESTGLTDEALAISDVRVGIPMSEGMECLNVGAAAAIALHSVAPAIRPD